MIPLTDKVDYWTFSSRYRHVDTITIRSWFTFKRSIIRRDAAVTELEAIVAPRYNDECYL